MAMLAQPPPHPAHISSIGTAFNALALDADDVDDAAPPPTFLQATASTSIPVYLAPLRHRIRDALDHHTRLSHRLDALGDVPARITHDRHLLYSSSGRLTALQARVKTFTTDEQHAHRVHSNLVGNAAKRLLNRHPARNRTVKSAREAHERARADLDGHLERIAQTEREVAKIKAELADLERHEAEYIRLCSELQQLNDGLFAGPTPEFPEEDLLEWEHIVLLETQRQLHAEANRERRARQLLNESSPSLQSCIADLQRALQLCIDLGVPQNRRYSSQLFVGGSTSSTVKATTSLVLRTKTNSGKFYTLLARARGSQALVRRPPEFGIIELHLMPGQRSAKAVDEKGLLRSLETSYAQARFCETYLRDELARSHDRQRKLKEEAALLDSRIVEARREMDAYRRRIVVAVSTGDEESLVMAAKEGDDKEDVAPSSSGGVQSAGCGATSSPSSLAGTRHSHRPVIVGRVINESILRETVLSHASRHRSFSLTATTAAAAVAGDEAPSPPSPHPQSRGENETGQTTETNPQPNQLIPPPSPSNPIVVVVQSPRDANVAATLAMSAVTDVETPAERTRKEALRRLRTILAASVGTPDGEVL